MLSNWFLLVVAPEAENATHSLFIRDIVHFVSIHGHVGLGESTKHLDFVGNLSSKSLVANTIHHQ